MKESNIRQVLSEIILPPGSTSADLQVAIDNAPSGDTIVISGDMPFTDIVTVPVDKEITIQSDEGNNWVMSQSVTNVRHFGVGGRLILQNITLDGGEIGGGVSVNSGSLEINEGAIIQNCHTENEGGGGVYLDYQNSTAVMTGGIIRNNTADYGGGIRVQQGDTMFTMTGGTIIGNSAEYDGGGLYSVGSETKIFMSGGAISNNKAKYSGGGICLFTTDFIMSGGEISGNTADYEGGGGFLTYDSSFTMTGGKIVNNTTKYQGGAISLYHNTFIMTGGIVSGNLVTDGNGGAFCFSNADNIVEISGKSYITNNKAPNGMGGAIFLMHEVYDGIPIGSETVFSCNSANEAYAPPEDARTLYPNIQFASTSITDHPLNNFDINYTVGDPIDERFHIIYDANGGSGSYTGSEIEPGGMDTVLSLADTGISRPGYSFTGWNTESDGSGIAYTQGDIITLLCSVVLFAQWNTDPGLITITYNSNGGTGSHVDTPRQYDDYTVLSAEQAGISRLGFIFVSWNTLPDGSGETFMPGDRIAISVDVGLYARWMANPTPVSNKMCRTSITKCRTSVEGRKIWIDNDNESGMRPDFVEIILLRDGEPYKRLNLDSMGDGYFGFCCLPKWKNSNHKYNYKIDETVPDGYTKTIEGYNIINTLNP